MPRPSVKFYLDARSEAHFAPIYFKVSYLGKAKQIRPSVKGIVSHWDQQKQTFSGISQSDDIARELIDKTKYLIEHKIPNEFIYEWGREPSFEELIEEYEIAVGQAQLVNKDLVSYMKEYAQLRQDSLSESTVYNITRAIEAIEGYQRVNRIHLTTRLTDDIFVEFVNYCERFRKVATSTIKLYLVVTNSVLSYFSDEFKFKINIKKSLGGRKIKKKISSQKTLTQDEVMKISKMGCLTQDEEYIRDMFVLCCFSGLRASDLPRVQRQDNYLVAYQKKTGDPVQIPINNIAHGILGKWILGKLPNNYNQTLRDMLSRNKFPTQIALPSGEVENIITFHLARKTAFNIWIDKGIDLKTASVWLGHASLDTTLRWYNEQKAKQYDPKILNV